MFLRQIAAVFLARTSPDSSIAKPAAMNITSAPQTRNEKLLNTYAASADTAASAGTASNAPAKTPAPHRGRFFFIFGLRIESWAPTSTVRSGRRRAGNLAMARVAIRCYFFTRAMQEIEQIGGGDR